MSRVNQENNNLNNPKKMLAAGAKLMLVMIVMAFLGLHSFNFFMFTFPADQWYYAFLGFGLTSGGVILYLVMFKWEGGTKFQKTIALAMLAISVLGEILTAGFGMQIEGLTNAGWTMAQEDYKFMVLVIQGLGLFHGLSLILYLAGDDVAKLFADENKDGIPDFLQPDLRRQRAYHAESESESGTEEQSPMRAPSRNNHR